MQLRALSCLRINFTYDLPDETIHLKTVDAYNNIYNYGGRIIKITGIRLIYISNLERHSKQLAKRKKRHLILLLWSAIHTAALG